MCMWNIETLWKLDMDQVVVRKKREGWPSCVTFSFRLALSRCSANAQAVSGRNASSVSALRLLSGNGLAPVQCSHLCRRVSVAFLTSGQLAVYGVTDVGLKLLKKKRKNLSQGFKGTVYNLLALGFSRSNITRPKQQRKQHMFTPLVERGGWWSVIVRLSSIVFTSEPLQTVGWSCFLGFCTSYFIFFIFCSVVKNFPILCSRVLDF